MKIEGKKYKEEEEKNRLWMTQKESKINRLKETKLETVQQRGSEVNRERRGEESKGVM